MSSVNMKIRLQNPLQNKNGEYKSQRSHSTSFPNCFWGINCTYIRSPL